MEEITLKIGDKVRLYNGTFGIISDVDYAAYQIEISGEHKNPEWVHILNVKYVNDIDCERNVALVL